MTTPLERLQGGYYNSDPISEANPGGFADGGHVINFPAALADLATVAGGVVLDAEAIGQAGAMAQAAAASAGAAGRAASDAHEDAGRAVAAAAEVDRLVALVDATAEAVGLVAGQSLDAADAAERDRQTVEDAAEAILQDRQRAETAASEARVFMTAASDYRDEAKDYRDQTEVLANGAGLTTAQADARYRQKGEGIAQSDVQGLAAAIGQPWALKSGAFTANPGDRVLADTSAGSWALTLPDEGVVQVRDAAGTWRTNNLTIIGPIRGVSGDLVCDQAAGLELVRSEGATEWVVSKLGGVAA